jgi:hypothetical protein
MGRKGAFDEDSFSFSFGRDTLRGNLGPAKGKR